MALMAIPTVIRAQATGSLDEGTAYANFYAEQDCKAKAALGETFVATFKTSTYADPVFRQTVNCYFKLNNFAKVIALAGTVDQLFPSMKPEDKAPVFIQAMQAAQNSNNPAQTVAFGEKVLKIVPDEINTLIMLSGTIPFATPKDKAAVDKAQGYAEKGLTVLSHMDAKAAGMSDADWANQKKAIEGTLHNTLGSILFNKQDYDKAVDEMLLATKASPKEGSYWYTLGLAYNQQYQEAAKSYQNAVAKSNETLKTKDQVLIEESKATVAGLQQVAYEKRDQAIDALATAVASGGTVKEQAMDQLKRLYTAKNNGSADGLDQLVNSKKPVG